MKLPDLRVNYTQNSLLEADLPSDPLSLFDDWLNQVIEAKMPDPNAMTLATVDSNGNPSQRIVLLKGRPHDKFVFFTNYASNKAKDMQGNQNISLHFPWYLLERQVMVLGVVEKLPDSENDEYFGSRPKDSQLGALVSKQSQVLASREVLASAFQAKKQEYANKPVPRPNWGGYLVTPLTIEFWQGGSDRLHDRIRYSRKKAGTDWRFVRLNP